MSTVTPVFRERTQWGTEESPALETDLCNSLSESGKTPQTATVADWARAVACVLTAALKETREETLARESAAQEKSVNYLSIEYLLGPHTMTALHAAGLEREMRAALQTLGADPDAVLKYEPDPGLGNGGLGRLAACFLDSGANLNLPMTGYGLYYEKGFFCQRIGGDGFQREEDDPWAEDGAAWLFPQEDRTYTVRFYGHEFHAGRYHWAGAKEIKGRAWDAMIPGHDGGTVNVLRLWKAEGTEAETDTLIARINERLYPDDSTGDGKKLRLMQEYFFTSLSLQDIVARHLERNPSLDNLSETTAIQINDTHPAIAVAELMRILTDEHKMDWEQAKLIARQTCFYTNHTLMPEALEHWDEHMFGILLPRHKGIIQGLNADLMREIDEKIPEQDRIACKRRVSIIENGQIRMGHLAAFCTRRTNGVSAMHSDLVARDLFPDLALLRGEGAVTNHTNGITPRRWLLQANPGLTELIGEELGDGSYITDLARLDGELERLQDDPSFRARFAAIKRENKMRLAARVRDAGGPDFSPDALVDAQVKRFHEYKRQFMNLLHTVALYQDILENPDKPRPDTVKLFAGKAAPSYRKAKDYIGLAGFLAAKINADERVGDALKVVFVENYNVSAAQDIIPAADISEQISTAGTEASGTSNMKFALNGAVTVGTRDGANVEIGERAGEENIFFFGRTKPELDAMDAAGYDPGALIAQDERLRKALHFLRTETPFGHLADDVDRHGDHWKIAADFAGYWNVQEKARDLYLNDRQAWLTLSIANTRAGAHFSSDDTIRGYARMWNVRPSAAPASRHECTCRRAKAPAPAV